MKDVLVGISQATCPQSFKRDTVAIWFAAKDKRTPWYARALAILVAAYALSPIDLVPDFIPVLGYLDDLVLIPAGIALTLKLIPAEVMADARLKAEASLAKPATWWMTALIILGMDRLSWRCSFGSSCRCSKIKVQLGKLLEPGECMVTNYIISIGFVLLGAWSLYRAYAPRIKSQKAINWPTTEAEILETDIEEDRVRSATGKANIAFTPTVRYTYLVNGTRYEGNRITFSRAGFDFLDASNIRDQFVVGEKTARALQSCFPCRIRPAPKIHCRDVLAYPGLFHFHHWIDIVAFVVFQ